MIAPLADTFASPDAYLHSFDGDDAIVVPMDAAAYARSIFLDHRISPASDNAFRVPAASLPHPATMPTANWIFHVAHCGSTLLARALEALGSGLVLREPLALRQLALMPAAGRETLLPATLALLARRYEPDKPTLIKANVPVNFIAHEIAAAMPEARGILLYTDLPDYLFAVLRSDNHRQWVRNVTGLLEPHLGPLPATDAERAAALWVSQIERFASLVERGAAYSTINAEAFFDRPAQSLALVARHFGIAATADALDALVGGPLFSTYAKNPTRAFDNTARHTQRAVAADALSWAVLTAQYWLDRERPDWRDLLLRVAGAAD